MLLVDTSVWIEVFRRPSRFDLRAVTEMDEVVTCLPVIQEVLQGFRDEAAFRLAREAMLSLPMVESPLRQELFVEAANLYRVARRAGLTIRSSIDCLISACAMAHGLTVLHYDRDFGHLAKVCALETHEVLL